MTQNKYPFDGSIVLITGASTGIGRAVAVAFLENGANVVLAARSEDKMKEIVKGYSDDRYLIVPTDVRKRTEVDALVQQTVDHFGKLDVVISNAGVSVAGPIEELTDEDWENMRTTNVDSQVYLARAVVPHLEKSQGSIIATSSVSGLAGDWPHPAYNATKGAISLFVQSLALQLGEKGIRVNAIAPAFTVTEMTKPMMEEGGQELVEKFKSRVPLQRIADAEDVAPAYLFLASPDAQYITGVILPVDGGTIASNGQGNSPREFGN
ncbi:SDR family NAD(P)-dependent oxidoreductase [Paenibacillus wulumuqiensis]|uniref:SDR family NAD(P)-dependent oxidoreductase n=1 Tax=Paenibacillus wulumuqiensis TaxID=1567107 RepID=UPI0006195ECF|nr:SDR family oxidoreductase [Paenibacillus wulumuqiensis]